MPTFTRRAVLRWVSLGFMGAVAGGPVRAARAHPWSEADLADYFPSGDPKMAADTVLYAHSSIEKVSALLARRPELANAAIDWGFGDWETAIGAASHMGRRDMAELLLANGARPDLFTHAMLGHVDVVRAIVEAQPGIQGTTGPHGITLLSHAKAGKEMAAPVVAYLESVGGADPDRGAVPLALPAAAYVGEYGFGAGTRETLTVSEKGGSLRLSGSQGFPRNLVHTGEHRFYPAGARSVTVAFRVQSDVAVECTISGDEPILTAMRRTG